MSQDAGNAPPPNPENPYGLPPPGDIAESILPPEQRRAMPPPPPPAPEPELARSSSGAAEPEQEAPLSAGSAPGAKASRPLEVHQIGVAVRSMNEAMHFYGDTMGLSVVDQRHLADRQLNVVFVQAGNLLIELMEPTSEDTTVARFLERRGPGLHHLCFGTVDIEEHLRDLRGKGVLLIDDVPRPGAHGNVAFLDPAAAHGVLVELIQPSETFGTA